MARLDAWKRWGCAGAWLRMRDGRSKTAPIINHRMIHSIVPSPEPFVPAFLLKTRSRRESSSFLERDHLCCRERARFASSRLASASRPCEGGNLSPSEPGPSPRALRMPDPSLSLAANHPTHPLTLLNQPPAFILLVRSRRSSSLLLDAADSADLARAVNFIFPRHFSPDAVLHRAAPIPSSHYPAAALPPPLPHSIRFIDISEIID